MHSPETILYWHSKQEHESKRYAWNRLTFFRYTCPCKWVENQNFLVERVFRSLSLVFTVLLAKPKDSGVFITNIQTINPMSLRQWESECMQSTCNPTAFGVVTKKLWKTEGNFSNKVRKNIIKNCRHCADIWENVEEWGPPTIKTSSKNSTTETIRERDCGYNNSWTRTSSLLSANDSIGKCPTF